MASNVMGGRLVKSGAGSVAGSTGFTPLQTCADSNAVGTLEWVNGDGSPLKGTEIDANDDDFVGVLESESATTHYIVCTNALNVSTLVPIGATITGAQFRMRRKKTVEAAFVVSAMLLKFYRAGSVVGNDIGESGVDWTTTETAFTFGGAAELGGSTFTRTQAVAANTGCVISLTFGAGVTAAINPTHLIDLVEVNWHYTT